MNSATISLNQSTDTTYKYYYGIDVSKDNLVVGLLLENGQYKVQNIKNTDIDIAKYIRQLKKKHSEGEIFVTLEATGNYSMKVVYALCESKIPVAVLNPKQSKGFLSGVLLRTTKTDEKDACGLALYGKFNNPPAYKLPKAEIVEIKGLRTFLSQIKKQKIQISNQLHAMEYHPAPVQYVMDMMTANLERLKEQIAEVEGKLNQLSKEKFEELYKLAKSIKGIGPAIATALIMTTNGCEDFNNPKQLAKFLGVCPSQNESGTSVRGYRGITKTGEPQVRALLYMGARSARLYNTTCKDLYDRLRRKGKCHGVALNAVCHKMVKQFFAVVKSGVPFDNDYSSKNAASKAKETKNPKK